MADPLDYDSFSILTRVLNNMLNLISTVGSRDGVFTPCGVVPTRGDFLFRAFTVCIAEMGLCPPRVALALFANPYKSVIGQRR